MADTRRTLAVVVDLTRRTGVWRSVAAIGAALISGVAAVLLSLWLKLIVDGASRGDASLVTAAALALGCTVTVQAAATVLGFMFMGQVHFACGGQLVCDIMRAGSVPPGIEHHERPDFVDRVALLKQELTNLSGFVPVIGQGVGLFGRIGVTAVLLARVHPGLLLLPLLALPSLLAGGRAERIVNRANEASAERGRLEEHLFTLTTTSSPAKELRIFGLGEETVRRQREAWGQVTRVVARAQLVAGLLRTAGWMPFAAGYLGAVAFVLVRAGNGDATPGDVFLVMVLAGQVNGQVSQLLHVANRSATALRVLRRYLWLRDYAEEAVARSVPDDPAPVPSSLREGIAFSNVSFRYPGGDSGNVLDDVNLRFAAGSTVAIVGENGAGKTSLVKLLCRFYEPSSGSITADSIDLRRFDVGEWRDHLSGGFQDFARLELLLRESVGVGDIAAIDDRARVGAALSGAAASLPVSLDQQLGAQWEGGVDLSEGQWQKVAMARAMMRERPLLLLLDEPTSGLDANAEHALFELFASVTATVARQSGAVAVFVSHRFSTVRMADHIVVLDGGRVVEEGDHGQLMAAGGLYSELYGMQARAYS